MKNKLNLIIVIAIAALLPVFALAQVPSTDGGSTSAAPSTGQSSTSSYTPAPTAAPSPSTGGSSTSASTSASPSTGSSSTSAGDTSTAPSTGSSSTSAGSTGGSTPSTGGSSTSAGTTGGAPSTGGSSTSAGAGSTGIPSTGGSNTSAGPSTPTNGGGSNGGSNGGNTDNGGTSGGSNLGGSRRSGGVIAGINSCPLLTSYLKYGATNDPVQVSRLQTFLKNTEGLNVDVNGIFDLKTFNAVKAFQTKYESTILDPWGTNANASGYVYITTLKKINQIACANPLTLSASELAVINAFKNRPITTVIDSGSSVGEIPVEVGSNDNGSEVVVVVSTSTDNTASVGGFFSRIWNFIVSLFQRIF